MNRQARPQQMFPMNGAPPMPPGGVPMLGGPRQPTEAEMKQIMTAQELQAIDQNYKQMVCNLTMGMAMEWFKGNLSDPKVELVINPNLARCFSQSAHNIARAAIERAWGKHDDDDQVPRPGEAEVSSGEHPSAA